MQDYECNGYYEEIQPINKDRQNRNKTVSISVVPTAPKVMLTHDSLSDFSHLTQNISCKVARDLKR